MKKILLLLLLLFPSTALSQQIYDVSCRNVAVIRIVSVEAAPWNMDSHQGRFHVLDLELKPDAAREFVELRLAAPTIHVRYRGEDRYGEDIGVTANGGPLRNDVPIMTGFPDQGINIPIIRVEDAFEAARAVCPDLVPKKVLMDGQRE